MGARVILVKSFIFKNLRGGPSTITSMKTHTNSSFRSHLRQQKYDSRINEDELLSQVDIAGVP
jgi:hypothetical protein